MGKEWKITTIGSVFTTLTGTTPSKKNSNFYGSFIPFVKPPELGNSQINCAKDNLSESGAKFGRTAPENSILVSCIGSCLGKVGLNTIPVTFNQQINAILPAIDVAVPSFMFYQVLTDTFKNQLKSLASGTTIPIVNKRKFNSINIILPPIREQHRIASLLKNIDDLREKQRKALIMTKEMIPSLFYDMFPEDKNNQYIILKDLVKIHYGKALRKHERKEGKYPVCGANGCIAFHDKALIKFPTIIIGRVGSIGKVTFIKDGVWPIDTAYYVEPIEKIDLFYLYWFLKLSNLEHLSTSTCIPGLNRNILYKTSILVPPIKLQKIFTEKAHEILSLLDQQKKSLQNLDKLFESTLNHCFSFNN